MAEPSFEEVYGDPGPNGIFEDKCAEKVLYTTYSDATEGLVQARDRYHDNTLGKFICPCCGYYHVGHGRERENSLQLVTGFALPIFPKFDRPIVSRARGMFELGRDIDPKQRALRLAIESGLGGVFIEDVEYTHSYPGENFWAKDVLVRPGERAALNLLDRFVQDAYAEDLANHRYNLVPRALL